MSDLDAYIWSAVFWFIPTYFVGYLIGSRFGFKGTPFLKWIDPAMGLVEWYNNADGVKALLAWPLALPLGISVSVYFALYLVLFAAFDVGAFQGSKGRNKA